MTAKRLGVRTLMAALDVKSRETVRNMVKRKQLPPPIRDTPNGPRYWLESEVAAFLQTQAEQREAA